MNCCCSNFCRLFSIVSAIVIGFITALLRLTGVIVLTPAFLWVALGVAVVYLALLVLTSPRLAGAGDCVCSNLALITTGILGAVLTSVILLAIEFAATSIIGAIIAGALLLFLTLIITASVCLVRCIANCGN